MAIPTETVYGLGAWIESEAGLKKIFAVKERPFFDPLIVHVDTIKKAKDLSFGWTKIHEVLAQKCWPGPLTLIAQKSNRVHPLITSGLDSVGLRCPAHPLTLKLLSEIPSGIAAPSANKFGKTSPTCALHVHEEFGDMVNVLDGGKSEVGIESTVVGVSENELKIYRPGYFTKTMLKQILESEGIDVNVDYAQSPVAPGQLKHHYMPRIPLIIIPSQGTWEQFAVKINSTLGKKFQHPCLWDLNEDPVLASRELYEKMRSFDQLGFDIILLRREPWHNDEAWIGIWNRLEKAQTLAL